jgi:hypothetical protein
MEDGLIRDPSSARELEQKLADWDDESYRAVLTKRRAELLESAGNPEKALFAPESYRSQARTIEGVLAKLSDVLHDSDPRP